MSSYQSYRMRQHLRRLADLGVKVAEDLHAQALAARDAKTMAGLAEAFVKVSDEVRRTIALEARLARDFPVAERPRPGAASRAAAAVEPEAFDPDAPKPVKH
jgi:hypothetical protein